MKSCLVMLTKVFPFDNGEEFIENELPITAKAFDKVVLIATSTADNAIRTRAVPYNTIVHRISASEIMRRVKPQMIKNFFHIPGAYYGPREKKSIGGSPMRRLYLAYFIAKGKAVAKKSSGLLKKMDLGQYDAIIFYSFWFYDTALAAIELKGACSAKRCATYSRAHAYDLYDEKSITHYLPLRPYLLENLDRVFPCSDDGSNYLKTKYPESSDKVSTAWLGTNDFGTGPSKVGTEFHIVSCCHIVPKKRVVLLAQALAMLSGSGLKLKWTHCGGGNGLEKLKAYSTKKLGFMECRFPGELNNTELMKFYKETHVDLFVNTSDSEGLPVSIMEACSFGIPILATDVGGTSEIVRNGENGFLLDADLTPETLAKEIEHIAHMPQPELQKLRCASRKIWESDFSADKNYRLFAERISRPNI